MDPCYQESAIHYFDRSQQRDKRLLDLEVDLTVDLIDVFFPVFKRRQLTITFSYLWFYMQIGLVFCNLMGV
jgi:hypothetical protein